MQRYAIDTGAFQLYFSGNEKMKQIYNEIKNNTAIGMTMKTNLIELFYKTCKVLGKDVAHVRVKSILTSKIRVIDLHEKYLYLAGVIKCMYSNLSLADAIIAALAIDKHATIVTTDSDFKIFRDKTSVIILSL